jgi:type VI secretion system protein ImpB
MAKKSVSVAPPERINIKYVPATGDQQAEIELPLKLLITGDFKGHGEETALEERPVVRIDKDNFDDVIAEAGIALTMQVPSRLGEAGQEALVALKGPLGNVPAFRKQLQTLLADDKARTALAKELNLVLEKPAA